MKIRPPCPAQALFSHCHTFLHINFFFVPQFCQLIAPLLDVQSFRGYVQKGLRDLLFHPDQLEDSTRMYSGTPTTMYAHFVNPIYSDKKTCSLLKYVVLE